jgi:hypothetical protein
MIDVKGLLLFTAWKVWFRCILAHDEYVAHTAAQLTVLAARRGV